MGKRVLFTRGAAALALSIATMMGCAGVGATAFAVDYTVPEAYIFIHGDAKQLENHHVKALKIANFNAVSDDGSGYDVTSVLTGDSQKTFDDAVKKIDPAAETNAANEHLTLMQYVAKYWTGTADDQYGNKKANNENLRKLADALKGLDAGTNEYVSEPIDDPFHSRFIGIPVDFGSKTDDNHGGLYLIIDQAGYLATGKDSSSNSLTMIVSSQIQANDGSFINTLNGVSLGQVNVKNEIVSVKMTRTGVNNGKDANDVAGIGDTVHFKLNANVPTFNDWPMVDVKEAGPDGKMDTGDDVTTKKPANAAEPGTDGKLGTDDDVKLADGPLYQFINIPTGLVIDPNKANVKVRANTGADGAFVDLKPDQFTVGTTGPNAEDLAVTLKDAYAHRGQKLEVTYDAVVSDIATVESRILNAVDLEWSNDPYDVSSTAVPTDENETPLADIRWDKYDWDDRDKNDKMTIDGATFQLKNGEKFATFRGNVFKGWASAATAESDLVARSGTVEVKGLPEGTFHVMETKAPDGYIRGQGGQQLQFDVTIDNVAGKTDVNYTYAKSSVPGAADFVGNGKNGWVVNTTANNKSTASIYNTRNISDMPKTGGQFLLVAGIATGFIILGIGGTFVAKRSRRGIAA